MFIRTFLPSVEFRTIRSRGTERDILFPDSVATGPFLRSHHAS